MENILRFLKEIPSTVEEEKVFLLIIDGLGRNKISPPSKNFRKIVFQTVFPSSTPTFFYTFHSLLPPEKHGYLEWYMRFKNEIVAIPPWKTISGKELELGKEIGKKDVFPFKPLSQILSKKGFSVCYYTPFADSVFTKTTSKGAEIRGINYFSEIFPLGDHDFSFIYWPSIDVILHERFKDEAFRVETEMINVYISILWKKIPRKSKLIIMSDHGLTEIKREVKLPIINGYPVGGGRVAFYKAEKEDVEKILKKRKIPAKVFELEEIYRSPVKRCYENFGNVVVIAEKNVGFRYPFGSEEKLRGSHGGMTKEEMLVKVWICEK